MAGFSVRVEGLRELDANLAKLTRATARNVLRRTLIAAAQPTVAEAQARAPRDTGALAASIAASARSTNDVGRAEYAAAMKSGAGQGAAVAAMRAARRAAKGEGSFAEVFVGPTLHERSEPKARVVEFGGGRGNRAPQAFLRPAWDATREQVLNSIREQLAVEIDKAVARAARRAARARA